MRIKKWLSKSQPVPTVKELEIKGLSSSLFPFFIFSLLLKLTCCYSANYLCFERGSIRSRLERGLACPEVVVKISARSNC
jgi:hypothetical protein